MKRIIVPALVATALLICAAVGTWLALVASVASAALVQARVGGELLDARVPVGAALARTLMRPGLHVTLVDRDAGIVVDAGSAGFSTHALAPTNGPPRDGPPFSGPPFSGPPLNGAPFDGPPLSGPPPNGPPLNGLPGTVDPGNPSEPSLRFSRGGEAATHGLAERGHTSGGPPGPLGPLDSLATALARIAPIVVQRDARILRIDPDALELGRWLGSDALVAFAGIAAIGAFAGIRSTTLARLERAVLEARVAEKREAAERYQRFLAETGHELRTPLTVITGYVDILLARKPDEPLDERIIDGMHAEAARMRVLVDKMMTLARLESDRSIPRLIDIGGAAREAAQTLARRYPQREIRVAEGPSASIVIDADDYAAALGNILENAVKYAPGSPILIETALRDGSASTAVIDRGPGIAPGDEEAIFERFYRGRAFGEGLGLGLAIVKRIAERWNGSIECESAAGRTTFRLNFPIADEEAYGVVG